MDLRKVLLDEVDNLNGEREVHLAKLKVIDTNKRALMNLLKTMPELETQAPPEPPTTI